ncbi:hypothetical protein P8610_13375 [Fictibacillus sp. UD]|uniref:hypothetical protein n=1 Tax=Fictibacillus sp. UD TaxID=3038777 RepID=UPI003745F761
MNTLWYNNRKVCDVTSLEYEAIRLLLPYWGLKMSEDDNKITGALSTFMLGIHGLTQQKVIELNQLLQHTGITITTDDREKCDQRFYVDFHENHPMPLALKTPDQKLYYLNPTKDTRFTVQTAIHKGITLKRKDGPLFLAIQPSFDTQATEWISYLIVQTFLRSHFEALTSISEATFFTCVEKVLDKINDRFASIQLSDYKSMDATQSVTPDPDKASILSPAKESIEEKMENQPNTLDGSGQKIAVPQIRPFSASGSLITSNVPKPYNPGLVNNRRLEPINPFNSSTLNQSQPIHPFSQSNTDPNKTSVISPFHSKEHTSSLNREYTRKDSRIYKQRRDGK